MSWARRFKRVFGIEIEDCARCGGKLRVIATAEASALPSRGDVIALPRALVRVDGDKQGRDHPHASSRQPARPRHVLLVDRDGYGRGRPRFHPRAASLGSDRGWGGRHRSPGHADARSRTHPASHLLCEARPRRSRRYAGSRTLAQVEMVPPRAEVIAAIAGPWSSTSRRSVFTRRLGCGTVNLHAIENQPLPAALE